MTMGDPTGHDDQVFILAIADRLRESAAPLDVMYAALEMIGSHLGVNRVGYCDVENADGTLFYPTGWGDGLLQPLTGRLPMAFLGDALVADLRCGEVAIISDVDRDPRLPPGGYAAIGTKSALGVPLVRDGVWVAGLFVHHAKVKEWSSGEIQLLQDVLERTWDAVERARAEEGRRRLERRQSLLVDLLQQQRHATTESDVLEAAARAIGLYLDTDRTGFFELPDDETVLFAACWTAGRLPILEGSFPATGIGVAALAQIRLGEIVAFSDALVDEIVAGSVFPSIGARAGIGAPIVRNGRWHAGLYVNHAEPRAWLGDEIALVREIVELTWDAVERIRAVRSLAENNASLEKRVDIAKAELQATNDSLEQRIIIALRDQAVMEDALRQAQKMEAVGQLTGGLAHDFNNLLAGISGSLEMMERRIEQGRLENLGRYMTVAQGAASRAAALTHRLLAFSRRQTLDPRPTDVNRLIEGMDDLIRRTIGPQIVLKVAGAPGSWIALIDQSQLENALLNLCINARDAMPDGGRITIETANRWFDEPAATAQGIPEGQYLSIGVTDTGVGMSPEVIAKVFEPFFTTKPIGEGTGLGLSMIYGFAKQSGGHICIRSEVGQGTTVCMYLPRHHGEADADEGTRKLQGVVRVEQGEVVLVVDDEPTVRMLVMEVLDELGHTGIEAADSVAGLKLLRSDVHIDLLVTDVGLPGGMNGRQMADAGREKRADLKVLFITGYAESAALGSGHLKPGMQVLTKPFAMEALASKISALLA